MVTSQAIINHNDPVVRDLEVMQVLSSPSSSRHNASTGSAPANTSCSTSGMVWTYLYPGCHVYLWDPTSKQVMNRLDCSKLVPCSESLKTIAIDEHFVPGRSGQVSALALQVINSTLSNFLVVFGSITTNWYYT